MQLHLASVIKSQAAHCKESLSEKVVQYRVAIWHF